MSDRKRGIKSHKKKRTKPMKKYKILINAIKVLRGGTLLKSA